MLEDLFHDRSAENPGSGKIPYSSILDGSQGVLEDSPFGVPLWEMFILKLPFFRDSMYIFYDLPNPFGGSFNDVFNF